MFAAGAIEREEDLPLCRVRLDDVDENLVVHLELAFGVGAQRLHLVAQDDALGLGADIDEDAIAVPAHDGAVDDFAA